MTRYRSPIILQRAHEGAASRIGNQRIGSNNVRVLKAFTTVSPSGVDLPSVAAPANHLTPPGNYPSGWTAWWPAPPDAPPTGYRIPDPPVIARTVLPTADNPVLWEATAEVGTSAWTARISAVYVHCEWRPKTGKEMMSGVHDLSIEMAALKVRPSIIATAGINTIEWNVLRLQEQMYGEPFAPLAASSSIMTLSKDKYDALSNGDGIKIFATGGFENLAVGDVLYVRKGSSDRVRVYSKRDYSSIVNIGSNGNAAGIRLQIKTHSTPWKLEAMQSSFRRQEFVELLVQRENQ